MAEEDDANYRRRLSDVLTRHGFAWVVTQAEIQIAEGKPSAKQVSERQTFTAADDALFLIKRPRTRRASLITSEPYTEAERLEILLHAMEAAVAERANLEKAVLDQLEGIEIIDFQPDVASEEAEAGYLGKPHRVHQSQSETGRALGDRLKSTLMAIREVRRAST